MSIRALLAKERILNLIQAWDEKQIETWRLPELLPQLLNDSKTIEEEHIKRKQMANLEIRKEESFKKKDMSIEEIMSEMRLIDDEIKDITNELGYWKQISDKRTKKNQAKTDKTEHGMEKHGKDKVKSKPKTKKSTKVNPEDSLEDKQTWEVLKDPTNLFIQAGASRLLIIPCLEQGKRKRISEKMTKNQAKTDKIEHEMEKHRKAKVKPKSKSKSTRKKSTVKTGHDMEKRGKDKVKSKPKTKKSTKVNPEE
ncbi:hypothetical protein Tco_1541569 [Tanacetum coccineum]